MNRLAFTTAIAGVVAFSGVAAAQVAVFATNPQGSLGYTTGIAVAKTVTEKAEGIIGRPQPMGGSTNYIPIVNRGEVDFGFSNGMETLFAYNGTGTFELGGNDNPAEAACGATKALKPISNKRTRVNLAPRRSVSGQWPVRISKAY